MSNENREDGLLWWSIYIFASVSVFVLYVHNTQVLAGRQGLYKPVHLGKLPLIDHETMKWECSN